MHVQPPRLCLAGRVLITALLHEAQPGQVMAQQVRHQTASPPSCLFLGHHRYLFIPHARTIGQKRDISGIMYLIRIEVRDMEQKANQGIFLFLPDKAVWAGTGAEKKKSPVGQKVLPVLLSSAFRLSSSSQLQEAAPLPEISPTLQVEIRTSKRGRKMACAG